MATKNRGRACGCLLVLAMAMAGCTRGYAKPGASYQQFMQEYVTCERGMVPSTTVPLALALGGGGAGLIANAVERGRTNRCMQALGWEIRRGDDVYRP